ncbi:MAG: PAS domain-containing protein [Methanomicrobiaceae archaeon]|nr:PAS domain-containing protein [Methanomicrobiaceae archaeon]
MNSADDYFLSIFTGLKEELVIVIDLSVMIVAGANEEACRMLGYDAGEISGMRISDIMVCFRNSDNIGREKEIFSGKSYFSGFLTGDHNEIPVSFSLNRIATDGRDYGIVIGRRSAISIEIPGDTDLSLIQYKKALDSIDESLVVVDRDLRIRLYNAPFKYLVEKYGYRGELIGIPLNEAAGFLTGRLCLEYKYVFQSGKSLGTSIKKEYGSKTLWYEIQKSPLMFDGKVAKVVSVIRETTRQQELEQMKKESIFQIEKNMEQFAILNDHIRNPLQAIVGLADLEGGETSEKIIEFALEIDDIVKELDSGWLESDKIREMLLRHYGLKVTRRPNISSPIGMLTVVESEKSINNDR